LNKRGNYHLFCYFSKLYHTYNCFITDSNTYEVCSNVINQIYNEFDDFDNYNYKNTDKQLLTDIEQISVSDDSNDTIIVNLICEPELSIVTST
jgi:signal-transduction protein with cAMP-binding, CBS, and nucleotidyltransferase domain